MKTNQWSEKNQCLGITKSGAQCKKYVGYNKICNIHSKNIKYYPDELAEEIASKIILSLKYSFILY